MRLSSRKYRSEVFKAFVLSRLEVLELGPGRNGGVAVFAEALPRMPLHRSETSEARMRWLVLAVLLSGCSFTLVRYESYACPPKEKVSDDAKMAKQVHPVVDANCPVVSTLPRDE
jgi:hypothetical protein